MPPSICSECGKEVPDKAKICLRCGSALPKQNLVACSVCGKAIADTAGTCPHCGGVAESASTLVPCPECGKDVSRKAESCPHCGFRLRIFPSPFLDTSRQTIGEIIVIVAILYFVRLLFR